MGLAPQYPHSPGGVHSSGDGRTAGRGIPSEVLKQISASLHLGTKDNDQPRFFEHCIKQTNYNVPAMKSHKGRLINTLLEVAGSTGTNC